MKAILTVLMTLSFNSAFAKDYIDYGHIHFQSASTWVKAENVCSEGGMLYHKKKDFVTVEYCSDRGSNCKVVKKALAQPMKSTRKRCDKYQGDNGSCTKWITVAYNQGTTKAAVYRSFNDMVEGRNPKKTFSYTVDRCED